MQRTRQRKAERTAEMMYRSLYGEHTQALSICLLSGNLDCASERSLAIWSAAGLGQGYIELTLDALRNRARYVAPITNRRVELSDRRAHNGAWSQSPLLRSV